MSVVMEFPDSVDEFMEQYKSIDTECVYSNGIEYVPIFRMKQWFEHLKVKPKTNADRIRCMTDEELAKWFCSMCNFGDFCPYQDDCDTNGSGIIKWMKEEVKDDV